MKTGDLELPDELRGLYRHWEYNTEASISSPVSRQASLVNSTRLNEVEEFAKKRMQAWSKRQNNIHPTSDDDIIAQFKFCNIYRELDKQTIYFHQKLNPYRNDLSFWLLNMFAFRFYANMNTVDRVGLLKPGEANFEYLKKLKRLDKPKFGNAYVFPISTIQNSPWSTREEFISNYVPVVIEAVAQVILSKKNRTVNQLLADILPVFGFNHKFLWTEVLIDVHYQYPELVDLSKDFYIGPGAKPSLEYLKNDEANELNEILNTLSLNYKYIEGVNLKLDQKKIPLSAENWEGICCEFRKYRNLKAGKGRRRLYKFTQDL